MSKNVSRAADTLFPGSSGALNEASNAAHDLQNPDLGTPADVPTPADNALAHDPEIQQRVTQQVPDREKQLRAAAEAAGVTRSGNDADLLGKSGPKRKAASRTLLGSR